MKPTLFLNEDVSTVIRESCFPLTAACNILVIQGQTPTHLIVSLSSIKLWFRRSKIPHNSPISCPPTNTHIVLCCYCLILESSSNCSILTHPVGCSIGCRIFRELKQKHWLCIKRLSTTWCIDILVLFEFSMSLGFLLIDWFYSWPEVAYRHTKPI